MKKLQVGLVGTGFISGFHREGFLKNSDARLVGLCTHSNRRKLHTLCEQWELTPYSSFEAMAADPQIDALVIGSINTEHYSQVLRAIEAGKSVLVEKPVVTDLDLLEDLETKAAKNGVLVMPAHNFVYNPALRAAKELLSRSALGRLTFASFASSHTISEEHANGWRGRSGQSSGGALMDSGHHQAYLSIYLMGVPQQVHCFQSRLIRTGMDGEDIAQVQLKYPSGALGSLLQSWTSDHGEGLNGIRILGESGQLAITDALYLNGVKIGESLDYAASFVHQSRAFTDAILKGIAPLSSLDDARQTLRLIQAAYQSGASGQSVTLA